jgi:hypothetical protein
MALAAERDRAEAETVAESQRASQAALRQVKYPELVENVK